MTKELQELLPFLTSEVPEKVLTRESVLTRRRSKRTPSKETKKCRKTKRNFRSIRVGDCAPIDTEK